MKIWANLRWLIFGGIMYRLRGFFIGLVIGVPLGVFCADKVVYYAKFIGLNL